MKSCQKCDHSIMCGWKGNPPSGSASGGYFASDFKAFREEWYLVHAKWCVAYAPLKDATPTARDVSQMPIRR